MECIQLLAQPNWFSADQHLIKLREILIFTMYSIHFVLFWLGARLFCLCVCMSLYLSTLERLYSVRSQSVNFFYWLDFYHLLAAKLVTNLLEQQIHLHNQKVYLVTALLSSTFPAMCFVQFRPRCASTPSVHIKCDLPIPWVCMQ